MSEHHHIAGRPCMTCALRAALETVAEQRGGTINAREIMEALGDIAGEVTARAYLEGKSRMYVAELIEHLGRVMARSEKAVIAAAQEGVH